MRLSRIRCLILGVGLLALASPASAYNGAAVHNDGSVAVTTYIIYKGVRTGPWVTPGPGATQAGDVNTDNTGDAFTIEIRGPGNALIGYITANVIPSFF